jgi:hypothetical protein
MLTRTLQAIQWSDHNGVDIILISCSLPENLNQKITAAIQVANSHGIIIFAPWFNGENNSRTSPASLSQVFSIHASDANGNKLLMNPPPQADRENFSTLGGSIPSISSEGVYISGISYATAVAAAVGANVLHFIQGAVEAGQLTKEEQAEALHHDGMKRIFLAMSERCDGYDFIRPWLWNDGDGIQDVFNKIKLALGTK